MLKGRFTLTARGPFRAPALGDGLRVIGTPIDSGRRGLGVGGVRSWIARDSPLFYFAEDFYEVLADLMKDTRGRGSFDQTSTPLAISDRRQTLLIAASRQQTSSRHSDRLELLLPR